MNQIYSAQISCRDESRQISDDSAAERDNRRLAVKSELNRPRVKFFSLGKTFGSFAVGNVRDFVRKFRRAGNIFLRDDESFARDKFFDAAQNVFADKNFVAGCAEVDKNFFHKLNS